jgi:tetratricopeptide (TPR) repeat protein
LVLAKINIHLSYIERSIGTSKKAEQFLNIALSAHNSKISEASIPMSIQKLLIALISSDKNTSMSFSDAIAEDQTLVFLNMGQTKQQLVEFEDAEKAFEEAYKIINGCDHIKHLEFIVLQHLGSFYIKCKGDAKNSLKVLLKAKEIVDKTPNMEKAYVYYNLAENYFYLKQYQEAINYLTTGLEIAQTTFPSQSEQPEHFRVGQFKAFLGLVQSANSSTIKESFINLEGAIASYKNSFKEGSGSFAFLYASYSYALEQNHKYEDAIKYLRDAQNIANNTWGINTNKMLAYRFCPIEVLPTLDKTNVNINYYSEALELMKKLLGEEHARVARYYYLLGQVYENAGNNAQAKQNYQNALDIAKMQKFTDEVLIKGNQNNIEIIQKHL